MTIIGSVIIDHRANVSMRVKSGCMFVLRLRVTSCEVGLYRVLSTRLIEDVDRDDMYGDLDP